jgi:hypothetical protein
MPWSRAGEYCMGILCCFSVLEDREGEPPHIRDIFHVVVDSMKQWMNSFELFSLTFLQTWTILFGGFFLYEGYFVCVSVGLFFKVRLLCCFLGVIRNVLS